MDSGSWRKSPKELEERFAAAVAGIEGMEQRKMFGYPAAFVGGNLTTCLFQDSWAIRLPADERQDRLDAGWAAFSPMPDRPMREYVALPEDVIADPDRARAWVERAAEYVRTLPPKQPKKKKA